MLTLIKKALSLAFRKKLSAAKRKTVDHLIKVRLSRKMAKRHMKALIKLKTSSSVRVVFLVIHKSVWKVDPVFLKMLADPLFDPVILVCPYSTYGKDRMIIDLEDSYNHFLEKGYPVFSAFDKQKESWIEIDELNPDIVLFTNPHNLTNPNYYQNAYNKFLSCYVPYYYLATDHAGKIDTYNLFFHNAMWKIFMPHQFSLRKAESVASNKGSNCVLTGYPSCESLLFDAPDAPSAWRTQTKLKKRIIFAPHHSIEDANTRLSNFLIYADFFVSLSKKYETETQWSFKPHPILKSKLYLHPDWGKKRTDEYYDYWATSSNTQLDEGEYSDLFLQSDAIIHDSSSFIVEYLFVKKPCLYLLRDDSQLRLINDFGLKALDAYRLAMAEEDIEFFISSIIGGDCELKDAHFQFIAEEISPLYGERLPSDRILDAIKHSIAREGA